MIGSMREQISFYSPVNIPVDGAGFETQYKFEFTRWCKAEPYRGQTGITDSQFKFDQTLKFTLRYEFQVQPEWVIIYNNRVYTIQDLRDIQERDRYMIIIGASKYDFNITIQTT